MSKQSAETDQPGDFVVVRVYGDGEPYIVACLRCDWQSGKGARAWLLGTHGPARAHERDKHGGVGTSPGSEAR